MGKKQHFVGNRNRLLKLFVLITVPERYCNSSPNLQQMGSKNSFNQYNFFFLNKSISIPYKLQFFFKEIPL